MEYEDYYDDSISIVMMGDSSVGKSSISYSYKKGAQLCEKLPLTVGFDVWTKNVTMDGLVIKTIIFDTSGEEKYGIITNQYMRQGDGVVLVFDVTSRPTFENIQKWYDKVKEVRNEPFNVTLIGNKIDLEDKREISSDEGRQLAENLKALYIETSCYDHITIEDGMAIAFKKLFSERLRQNSIKRRTSVKLSKSRGSANGDQEDKCQC